jgi:hypothetical protein
MGRLFRWIGGAVGGVAAYRWLRGRPRVAAEPPIEPDERADALRARLAENRAAEEPSPAEPGEPPEAVEERRRRVYEEGRGALGEMKSDVPGDESPT